MSRIDAMGIGYLVGLVISLAMWWRIDIQPQIREIRRAEPPATPNTTSLRLITAEEAGTE